VTTWRVNEREDTTTAQTLREIDLDANEGRDSRNRNAKFGGDC